MTYPERVVQHSPRRTARTMPFEDLASSFQARHIAVPIGQAVPVRSDERAGMAAERLLALSFDQAPVIDAGPPSGFVLRRHLEAGPDRLVRDHATPLGLGNVVSADAPIGEILDWIVDPGLLFVMSGREIAGFVTVSDFNKQPARAYLYMQLAALETGIADLARRRFGTDQEQALALLEPDDRRDARRGYNRDKAVSAEADLIAYLGFRQILKLANADRIIRERLRLDALTDFPQFESDLADLRNRVMHPARGLVAGKGALIDVRDLEHTVRRLIATLDQELDESPHLWADDRV